MNDLNAKISELRQSYKLIYQWLNENGQGYIEQGIVKQSWSVENLNMYQKALSEMVNPDNASINDMYTIANNVRSGIFEDHYCVKVTDEINLGNLAGQIISNYNEFVKENRHGYISK